MSTTKIFLFAMSALALLSACEGTAPTTAELNERCSTGCARIEALGCPQTACVSTCEATVADAERTGCLVEVDAMMGCTEALSDELRCDGTGAAAACASEINTYLACQSAE